MIFRTTMDQCPFCASCPTPFQRGVDSSYPMNDRCVWGEADSLSPGL